MGRKARQRMEAREAKDKTMARWAQENQERFEHEWTKRVNSWLGEIWSSKIFFTEKEYKELLENYPMARDVVESLSNSHDNGFYIYLNKLTDTVKKELGSEVINEILSHTKSGKIKGKPIFDIVDYAKKRLMDCGEKAMALQLQETTELLNNECCRALAPHIGHEIYTLNKYRRPEEEEINNGRRLKSPSRR